MRPATGGLSFFVAAGAYRHSCCSSCGGRAPSGNKRLQSIGSGSGELTPLAIEEEPLKLFHLKQLYSLAAYEALHWNYDRAGVAADVLAHTIGLSLGLIGATRQSQR